MNDPVSVKKYIKRYFIVNTIIAFFLFIVSIVFDFEMPSSMGVISFLFSCQIAGSFFVKDQKRLPNKMEKKRLIWGSFAMSIMLSFLAFSLFFIYGVFEVGFDGFLSFIEQSIPEDIHRFGMILLIISPMLLGVYYLCASFAYGRMQKAILKAVIEKEQDTK